MKYNNILSVLAIGTILLASCTDVEPIDVVINGQEQHNNVEQYKESPHGKTMTWFSNWTVNGAKNSYLSYLPDSLDIAVVTVNDNNLNSRQKADLKNIKENKHFTLLLPFNANEMIEQVTDQLDEVFDVIADTHTELDEDKPEDMEQLKELTAAEESRIKDTFKDKINQRLKETVQKAKSIGFDGVSIQAGNIPEEFIKKTMIEGIENAKKENILIMVEGNYKPFITIFKNIDYLVNTNSEPRSLKDMNKEYAMLSTVQDFFPEKFFWYVDLNQSKWKEPFSDVITSENPEARIYSIAKWKSSDKANTGLAIKGNEKTGNSLLRECIQYMSHK